MTRPDYCPVAQEPCQAMCSMSDVRCKIRDSRPQPKREWVGLTSEDIYACDEQSGLPQHEITNADLQAFACAIEAKLKEKNT